MSITIESDRIERVVRALARAARGNYTQRIDIADSADDFVEIEVGLNLLLVELERAVAERHRHLEEIETKNREIAERQSLALRQLATPVVVVSDGILALPVVGSVDVERAATMMSILLEHLVSQQARHVIIDITGVSVVDTLTAEHFMRMARAVRLLGAECYLTGISPAIAQTMASLGIDTTAVRTMRRMADAIHAAQSELVLATPGLARRSA